MGQGMADNFLKNGYKLFAWNRTKTVSEKFTRKGAVICTTPAKVSESSDIVFEVTANDKSSKSVWLGSRGIMSGANKGNVLIASSTLSIEWTDELVNICNDKGFKFLDIPLTGGRIGAETGNLTLLCGGKKSTLTGITSALKTISGNVFHFGPEGHGMRYKLILNFMQATHIVAFGQAMKIAKKSGMDLKKVGKGLAFRPGGVITEIANSTYFKAPDPITFSIEWIAKDLTYAKKFAKGLDISLLDDVLKEYKKALRKGYASKDWASINKLV